MPDNKNLCVSCTYCIPDGKAFDGLGWKCSRGIPLSHPPATVCGTVVTSTGVITCIRYQRVKYKTRLERVTQDDA